MEILPFLPSEDEINQLIGGLGPKLPAYMLIVKGAFMSGDVWLLFAPWLQRRHC